MLSIFKKTDSLYKVYAAITFVVLLVISQLLVYQQYTIKRAAERADLEQELEDTNEEFQTMMRHNISSANTIAMLYYQDTTLSWFDSTAKKLVELNPAIDLAEFLDSFVTTHIYPVKGYEYYLGKDPLQDPVRRAEVLRAVKERDLKFSAPFPMRGTGEKAIAGRQAVFSNGKFMGMGVVITKFSTIQRIIPEFQNKGSKFVFQLSSINSVTGKREYHLKGYEPKKGMTDSIFIPGENWTLHAAYAKGYNTSYTTWFLALFGLLFSAAGSAFVYFKTHATLRLETMVRDKTQVLHERMKELSAIYQVSEVLKDERQSLDFVFNKVVNIIPQGWKHTDACAAKIVVGDTVYATDNWVDSPYSMREPLQFVDGCKGYVEVVYCKEQTPEDEGPFLTGERDLIKSLADMLELFYNKKYNGERVVRSEAKMRSMIDATPVPLMLCDKTFRILAVNSIMVEKYQKITGTMLKVGDNFIEQLIPERREPVRNVFTRVMEDLEPASYDVSYDMPHGKFHLHAIVTPVTSNAEAIGVCTAMHDITKRKRKEKANRGVVSGLMQQMSGIVEYARGLARKTREPLEVISRLLARAAEEKNEKQRTAIIKDTRETAQHAEEVIKELEQVRDTPKENDEP